MTGDYTPAYDVVVVGCGRMGSSLARTLARSDLRVAAWNRTHERAEALAEEGVVAVRDLAIAVRNSEMVLACTATYANLYTALADIDTWHGNLFVNLTTGTPQESDTFATWAGERDVEVLDGSIFVYPRAIGTPDAYFVYSGPATAWSRGQEVLALLGTSRFVPGAHGLNSDLLLGMAAYYISGISCFVEAATYLKRRGMPRDISSDTAYFLTDMLKHTVAEAIEAIETDEHDSDQAKLETFAEGVEQAIAAFAAEGLNPRLLSATRDTLDAARAAGLGDLGVFAQTKVV